MVLLIVNIADKNLKTIAKSTNEYRNLVFSNVDNGILIMVSET